MNLKERMLEFIKFNDLSISQFERMCGLSNGFVDKSGDNTRRSKLDKISNSFPNLNINWLLTGEGEMLRPLTVNQKNANIHHGGVGLMNGGSVSIHSDEGKDQVIEEQKKEVNQMFQVLIDELHRFYEISMTRDDYIKRQDDYVKQQDEYLSRIIKESYLRNERNMERIDKLVDQQNRLLEMFAQQNERIQNRADKVIDILSSKM